MRAHASTGMTRIGGGGWRARSRKTWGALGGLLFLMAGSAWASVSGPARAEHLYAALQRTPWIAVGHGPKIVYEVFDPNCPYCHALFEELKPWVARGQLTIRAVPVGYLTPTSGEKAAAILMAKDPRKMLLRGEAHYSRHHGMEIPLAIPSGAARRQLRHNLDLVADGTGSKTVPVLVYKTPNGQARFVIGQPGPRMIKALMASIRR